MDNLGTFSIYGIPTVSGIDRSVSVDVFIGKDGRVKIDAVCVALSEKLMKKLKMEMKILKMERLEMKRKN